MRIAALYDIHGNLPALEAVLAEIRREKVDRILVGGDVLPGPMPRETLAALLRVEIPIQLIRGNGDRVVLAERAGAEIPEVPEQAREAVRWTARQLDAEHERWIAGWPKTLRIKIPGLGEVLFCHATPRNDTDLFTRLTPEARLVPMFEEADAPVVICGHTHMQFDRKIGEIRVINAGSVGMPFGEPGADWLLLGPDVQLRHTLYDLADAADRIARTGYPGAQEFAERHVLQPPTENEMLQALGQGRP